MSGNSVNPQRTTRLGAGPVSSAMINALPVPEQPIRSEKPKFSLTLKIFLAVAALVFLALGTAVEISSYRVRSIAEQSSRKALTRAKDSYDNFQEDRYEKLHRALRPVVDNSGFKALVHEGDAATIFNSLKEDQASATGADFLIVTDPRGVSLVRSDKKEWRHDLSDSALDDPVSAGDLRVVPGRARLQRGEERRTCERLIGEFLLEQAVLRVVARG